MAEKDNLLIERLEGVVERVEKLKKLKIKEKNVKDIENIADTIIEEIIPIIIELKENRGNGKKKIVMDNDLKKLINQVEEKGMRNKQIFVGKYHVKRVDQDRVEIRGRNKGNLIKVINSPSI